MNQSVAENLVITVKDYLEGEPLANIRHEYIDGDVYAMAGAGDAHVKVTLNAAFLLKGQLRGSGCSTYVSDMKVRIGEDEAFFYPDVMVTCDAKDQYPEQNYIKKFPKLIIEVLSPSTESKDRGKKFILYRTLESLEEYVLIDPREYYVELYRRQDNDHWMMVSFDQEDAVIEFKSVGMTCNLIDLYEDVVFG
ncbi:MAG TPA: Uma2 family endonuclease [Thiothrix sp.]|nr:Uma2 family endonuclease [Thiothrix sp.]